MNIHRVERQAAAGLVKYGELIIALAVAVLGFVVLWHSRGVDWSRFPAHIEPRMIPALIGLAQIGIGIWYAVEIVKFHRWGHTVPCDTDRATPTEWLTLTVFGVALLAYTLLIHRGGFVIASVVLLVLAAFGMGSRRVLRDFSCAVIVSAGVFLVFDRWLGIHLPEGWLSGVM